MECDTRFSVFLTKTQSKQKKKSIHFEKLILNDKGKMNSTLMTTMEKGDMCIAKDPGFERFMDNICSILIVPFAWQWLMDDTTTQIKHVREMKTKINLQLQKEGISDRFLLEKYEEQEKSLRQVRARLNTMAKDHKFTTEERHRALGQFTEEMMRHFPFHTNSITTYLFGKGTRPVVVATGSKIVAAALENEDRCRQREHKLSWEDAFVCGHMKADHQIEYYCACHTVDRKGTNVADHASSFWGV